MSGAYVTARMFSKCKREKKKKKITLIYFSMNVLQYNQYHQHQRKMDLLRKWCVEAVLLHFFTASSEICPSKMCFLSISSSLPADILAFGLAGSAAFQNGAPFYGSKLGSLQFLLF